MTLTILVAGAASANPAIIPSSNPAVLRQAINFEMNDLVRAMLLCLQDKTGQTVMRITRDVSDLSTLLDHYKRGMPAAQQARVALLNDSWQKLCGLTIQLMITSELDNENYAQFTSLIGKAKADVASAGGRKAVALIQPIVTQESKTEETSESKMVLLREFMTGWQDIIRMIAELDAVAAAPAPMPTTMPLAWPILGAALLISLLGGFWTAQFWTGRAWRSALEEIIRSTEAASVGDFSRPPAGDSVGTLGRLGGAIGRLMSVVERSENLVYQLSTLVDSSSEAIIGQNLDGTITSWNKGAQQLYGYGAEEAKGRSIAMLMRPEGVDLYADLLSRIRGGEKVQPIEMIHNGTNGRTAHVLLRLAPIFDSTRRVIGASVWATDLTPASRPPQIIDSGDIHDAAVEPSRSASF